MVVWKRSLCCAKVLCLFSVFIFLIYFFVVTIKYYIIILCIAQINTAHDVANRHIHFTLCQSKLRHSCGNTSILGILHDFT